MQLTKKMTGEDCWVPFMVVHQSEYTNLSTEGGGVNARVTGEVTSQNRSLGVWTAKTVIELEDRGQSDN